MSTCLNEIQELESKDNVTQQDKERYERLVQSRNEVVKAESFLNYFKDLEKNKNSKMAVNAYAEILDQQAAAALLTQEISSAIRVGETVGKEVTMEESKFALAEQKFNYDVRLEQLDYQNQRKIKELERDIKIELADLGITESSDKSNKDASNLQAEINQLEEGILTEEEIKEKARVKAGVTFADDDTGREKSTKLAENADYQKEKAALTEKNRKAMYEVNKKRVKAGQLPKYWHLVKGNEFLQWPDELGKIFLDTYGSEQVNFIKKRLEQYPDETLDIAMKKFK